MCWLSSGPSPHVPSGCTVVGELFYYVYDVKLQSIFVHSCVYRVRSFTVFIDICQISQSECCRCRLLSGHGAASFPSKKRARSNDVRTGRMPRAKRKCGSCGEEGKLCHVPSRLCVLQ